MRTSINKDEAVKQLVDWNFKLAEAKALVKFFEGMDREMDGEFVFDAQDIRCNYFAYSKKEIRAKYPESPQESNSNLLEWLQKRTPVINVYDNDIYEDGEFRTIIALF